VTLATVGVGSLRKPDLDRFTRAAVSEDRVRIDDPLTANWLDDPVVTRADGFEIVDLDDYVIEHVDAFRCR
jgi:hypothetical protein